MSGAFALYMLYYFFKYIFIEGGFWEILSSVKTGLALVVKWLLLLAIICALCIGFFKLHKPFADEWENLKWQQKIVALIVHFAYLVIAGFIISVCDFLVK